jgi:hypothetical protein
MEIPELTLSVYNQEDIDTSRVADIISSLLKTDVIPFWNNLDIFLPFNRSILSADNPGEYTS